MLSMGAGVLIVKNISSVHFQELLEQSYCSREALQKPLLPAHPALQEDGEYFS